MTSRAQPAPTHELQRVRELGFRRYKSYLRHASKHDLLERYLAEFLRSRARLQARLKALDIGAGTGRLAEAMLDSAEEHDFSLELHLIEPCTSAIVEMRAVLADHLRRNTRVEILEKPFGYGLSRGLDEYDLVLASHVSYYFPDLTAFVGSILQKVKEGGTATFVATSTSVMQNPLYQSVLRKLREDRSLPRTFDSDGFFTFGENLELELIGYNAAYKRTLLSSGVTFSPEDIGETIAAIEDGGCGTVLETMAFLWRYPDTALLTMREEWLAILRKHRRLQEPLNLFYEDMVLEASF